MPVRAVIFDFGGVILTSPFDAFARYEADNGLPAGLLRRLNATDPDTNAWARLERNEVDLAGFADLFEAEAAAAGHRVDGRAVLALLVGQLRAPMVEALRRCHDRLEDRAADQQLRAPRLAGRGAGGGVGGDGRADGRRPPPLRRDRRVEPGRRCASPTRRSTASCATSWASSPREAVFLDDLGVNLKPARAMGMTTIKVVDPDEAIAELEAVVGFPLG